MYVSCLVLAAGLCAADDSLTYSCPGKVHSVLRLDEASIEDINTLQARGLVKSVDLVHAGPSFVSIYLLFKTKFRKAYIQRISEVNPLLHAVSELNPDAFLIAHNLDNERAAGRVRG